MTTLPYTDFSLSTLNHISIDLHKNVMLSCTVSLPYLLSDTALHCYVYF